MTTQQLIQFIRDNILLIPTARIPETVQFYSTWAEAQISLASAQGVISVQDRKELESELEGVKIEWNNKRSK